MAQYTPNIMIDKEFLMALEDMAAYCESTGKKLPWAMDKLVKYSALSQLGIAQMMSAGVHKAPRDPQRSWAIPVPRITSRYFLSWKTMRFKQGTWIVYNDSREAFFIENGIQRNPQTGLVSANRVRRPIMKLSLLSAFKFLKDSAIGHRVWTDVFYPMPGQPGHRSKLISWKLSSPGAKSGALSTAPLQGFRGFAG